MDNILVLVVALLFLFYLLHKKSKSNFAGITCKDSSGKPGELLTIQATDGTRFDACIPAPTDPQTQLCLVEYNDANVIVNQVPAGCSTATP